MQAKRFPVALFSLMIFLLACKDKEVSNALINSPEYQQEELKVYNQLIDGLLDSVGFSVSDDGKLVFYLGDTLAGEGDWQGDDKLLGEDLKTRSFAISEITNSKHKFIRATDTLRLEPGERFTSRWLKLTRVRFNEDFTSGFLRVGVWCGNLCSWGGGFQIEKKDGRWQIVKKYSDPPA
jgi:hypothetical protein